ncbi:division/cell wall cluster transcriptional repressor MraZ [Pacificimonas flava]|uniref:Transcriptional regulator MraZ n=1 Tax=Pacificimonas flava TaxID=1234595 RepID=M2U2R8_9SPHN|nr:MraZ protein [Pacificimonas flava]EMD82143.1 MraZ protein [Pacificimonas flava]MBB5280377.1 MraZ protein [Pacificimonas flava]
MDAAVFQGNWLNTVDAKGRMSIPAAFRDVIQQRAGDRRVVLAPHRGDWDCLEARTTDHVADINRATADRYAADEVSPEEDMARLRAFSLSQQVQFEDTGRVVIPEDLRDFADLDGEVLLIGLGNSFQIWNPDLFLEQTEDERVKRFIRRKLEKARAK